MAIFYLLIIIRYAHLIPTFAKQYKKTKKRKENWSKGLTNKNVKLIKPRLLCLDSNITTDILYTHVFNIITNNYSYITYDISAISVSK